MRYDGLDMPFLVAFVLACCAGYEIDRLAYIMTE